MKHTGSIFRVLKKQKEKIEGKKEIDSKLEYEDVEGIGVYWKPSLIVRDFGSGVAFLCSGLNLR